MATLDPGHFGPCTLRHEFGGLTIWVQTHRPPWLRPLHLDRQCCLAAVHLVSLSPAHPYEQLWGLAPMTEPARQVGAVEPLMKWFSCCMARPCWPFWTCTFCLKGVLLVCSIVHTQNCTHASASTGSYTTPEAGQQWACFVYAAICIMCLSDELVTETTMCSQFVVWHSFYWSGCMA